MDFWIVTLTLLLISFLWSLVSLRKEKGIGRQVEEAKKELHKERILFRVSKKK